MAKIGCMVVNDPGNSFTVDIEENDSVFDLKKKISDLRIYDVPPHKLKLYLAKKQGSWLSISHGSVDDESLGSVDDESPDTFAEMHPVKKVRTYLGGSCEQKEDDIHVLVNGPKSSTNAKQISMIDPIVQRKIWKSVVRVSTPSTSGTGLIVDKSETDLYLLTNLHMWIDPDYMQHFSVHVRDQMKRYRKIQHKIVGHAESSRGGEGAESRAAESRGGGGAESSRPSRTRAQGASVSEPESSRPVRSRPVRTRGQARGQGASLSELPVVVIEALQSVYAIDTDPTADVVLEKVLQFELEKSVCWHASSDFDLLIFKIPILPGDVPLKTCQRFHDVHTGVPVHIFGFPGVLEGSGFKYHHLVINGQITGRDTNMFTVSNLSSPGLSGSAVVCSGRGVAIGYLGGGFDTDNVTQFQSYGYTFQGLPKELPSLVGT